MDDKENTAPIILGGNGGAKRASMSPRRSTRRVRSKSIGPGALDEMTSVEEAKREAKARRKSAFIPTTKSILSKNEDAEKAARRKTMVNRRVSFAPEATLHTWDIIESARDHTTSTVSADSTRRESGLAANSSSSPAQSSDGEESDEQEQVANTSRKYRRSSGIPPMNFNNPEDIYSSGVEGSSDASGSEEEDEEGSDDDTGTAMSIDTENNTVQSSRSDGSTGSSARLEAALKQAAQTAGTRGIEYDEYGDMSMEIAGDEITNAFQPWVQKAAGVVLESASVDQENINPFSTTAQSQMLAAQLGAAHEIEEDEEDDMSMDVTRAVGRIVRENAIDSSPGSDDGAMDLTQAVGRITGQKRRRSTADTGSPAAVTHSGAQTKRRRSSVARSSLGDAMELTMVVGGIRRQESPAKATRSQTSRRRSSGVASASEEMTMEFTRAVGGITATKNVPEESFDENEELTMELTTALGGIDAEMPVSKTTQPRPVTPPTAQSPLRAAANTTPKDQPRFKDTPDLGAKQLLTPIFQKQARAPTGNVPSPRAPVFDAVEQAAIDERARTPVIEPEVVAYPTLPQLDAVRSPSKTPTKDGSRRNGFTTPDRASVPPQGSAGRLNDVTPLSAKQGRLSSARSRISPNKMTSNEDTRSLADTIKLLSTPRKETLKTATPKKALMAMQPSPIKAPTPKTRPTPRVVATAKTSESPAAKYLAADLAEIQTQDASTEKIGLADFLTQAGIKFMDLTTTKRRMTVMPTPSKTRKPGMVQDAEDITLESSVIAAACTIPELELYQHACHELKRYTKEGKQMVAELEAETLKETPPLMLAYTHASAARKAELDVSMRDMKTNARLRSKELWYSWRSKLLDELMGGLSTIGENLIRDDEILGQSEGIVRDVLPGLTQQHVALQEEVTALEAATYAVSEEEREELRMSRTALVDVNATLAEKRQVLDRLRKQVEEEDAVATQLGDNKERALAEIKEANRVRESCRGVSVDEVATLKESVKDLEDTFGWTINSASASPPTITMTYRSRLQLFFSPTAFRATPSENETSSTTTPNAPIGLKYVPSDPQDPRQAMTTTLRFFLQLLQATLQGLPQCQTPLPTLLTLVSTGWDTAEAIQETERRLHIEAPTTTRILGDESLAIAADVLLPLVRTKVRASFEIAVRLSSDLEWSVTVKPRVAVVYGEDYIEKNMTEFLRANGGDSIDGWDEGVRRLREKLVARGPKGARK